MDQFVGIDVKIEMPNNITKRVKTPLSFEALFSQVKSLAQSKGVQPPLSIRYVDIDGENVVIEDDNDLEMAYTCAFSADKRIKFLVESQKSAPQKDVEMIQEEVKQEEVSMPAKSKKEKKDKGLPRKAIKTLIQRELESAAKETFAELMNSTNAAGEMADEAD